VAQAVVPAADGPAPVGPASIAQAASEIVSEVKVAPQQQAEDKMYVSARDAVASFEASAASMRRATIRLTPHPRRRLAATEAATEAGRRAVDDKGNHKSGEHQKQDESKKETGTANAVAHNEVPAATDVKHGIEQHTGTTKSSKPAARRRRHVAPPAPAAPPAPTPAPGTAPLPPAGSGAAAEPAGMTSDNWAGYGAWVAAAGGGDAPVAGTATAVYGEWTVPTVTAPPAGSSAAAEHTYCSIWIGVDGLESASVEQIGTESDWVPAPAAADAVGASAAAAAGAAAVAGSAQHYAWFEMYPAGAYVIEGFPVAEGDSISALVAYTSASQFTLSIQNHSKGVAATIPAEYTTSTTAERAGVEWVVEAPYENGVLPLANFSPVTISRASAVMDNQNATFANPNWRYAAITMVDAAGHTIASTSAPEQGTDPTDPSDVLFVVTRTNPSNA
jgi:hypothetical protein